MKVVFTALRIRSILLGDCCTLIKRDPKTDPLLNQSKKDMEEDPFRFYGVAFNMWTALYVRLFQATSNPSHFCSKKKNTGLNGRGGKQM